MIDKLIIRASTRYRTWLLSESSLSSKNIKKQILTAKDQISCVFHHTNKTTTYFDLLMQQADKTSKNKEYQDYVDQCIARYLCSHSIPNILEDLTCSIQKIKNQNAEIKARAKSFQIPSAREIFEEVSAVFNSWTTTFKDGILHVKIEDVTLSDGYEHVELGDFWASLDISGRPISNLSGMLTITPDDDSCGNGKSKESPHGYYHPHVSRESLCTGEGEEPILCALRQGRLEDFFTIVESILRTYNDGSPYEKLEAWYEPDHSDDCLCVSCETWESTETANSCYQCNGTFCDSCSQEGSVCESCENWFCSDCIGKTCSECDQPICDSCAIQCNCCSNVLCNSCSVGCPECGNDTCPSCLSHCDNCGDDFCNNCMDTCRCGNFTQCRSCTESYTNTCSKCDSLICDSCKTKCGHCGESVCRACIKKDCDYCGVPMCSECQKSHVECLLKDANEINDEQVQRVE